MAPSGRSRYEERPCRRSSTARPLARTRSARDRRTAATARPAFRGRDEIRSQLADARVIAEGAGDTRTIRFERPRGTTQPAPTTVRIPVEGEAVDIDGTPIAVLLHVIDGHVDELEIYRHDGEQILQDAISDLRTVVVNEG